MNEYSLLAWLRQALKRHNQWLIRSPEFTSDHKNYGRWSRWDKHGMIEANVDLNNLASRVVAAINSERLQVRASYKPQFVPSGSANEIPGSR